MGDIEADSKFIDTISGNFSLQIDSPAINAGHPGAAYADPDGTINDMGACGGPYAGFYCPELNPSGAPVITELKAAPQIIPFGRTLTIEATAEVK